MKKLFAALLAFVCLFSTACTTVPPTVEDGTTGQSTTETPATENVTTAEPTTDAPETEPVTTAPISTSAPETDPVTTEAVTTVTPETDPVTTPPDTTEPVTTEPVTTAPADDPTPGELVLDNDFVIYENDFSSTDLSVFSMRGTMQVVNGAVKAVGTNGTAHLAYKLPDEYKGSDYLVEVDCYNFNNMGGLLIGATKPNLSKIPEQFSGYACTTDTNGKTTQIMYFAEKGLGSKFAPATTPVPDGNCHMSVKVYKGAFTYRITSLDGSILYQEFRYEPGDHENDIYNTLTSTTGLFMSYSNTGRFDNFKVTIIKDDVIPSLTESAKLGDTTFKSAGLKVTDGVANGSGAMLTENSFTGDYRIKLSVANKNISRFYFGMDDEKNGYAVELDETEKEITLYKIENGFFSVLNKKSTRIREGFCDLIIDVHGGIASVYYDNLYQGDSAFPMFETYLAGLDGKLGIWLDGGQAKLITTGESTVTLPEATYLNPVNPGADPDMLFYKGTYYLYVYAGNDGNSIFTVYTSPDLVHFTKRNTIFTWDPITYSSVNGNTAWSPNVFYNESDGLFYLFFAAEQTGADTSRRVYYASSDSPYGPFTHDGPLVPINPNVTEIDGHPFVGYDGKTYMSFSRYDMGGTIWLEEVIIKDGVVTAKPETATRVVVPDMPWDNDGALRLVEGGFVWKHDGYYYLIYATGSYSRHYGEAVAISKNPLGPYEKCEYNPILNWNYEVDGPGDALMIHSPDGEEVYMVYHRHEKMGKLGLRQTCVDLVEFVPDPDGGPDILTVRGPSNTPQRLPSHKYRYDVNRDGTVNIDDAKLVYEKINGGEYSGYYDVDANGSLGVGDVAAILEKIGGNAQ